LSGKGGARRGRANATSTRPRLREGADRDLADRDLAPGRRRPSWNGGQYGTPADRATQMIQGVATQWSRIAKRRGCRTATGPAARGANGGETERRIVRNGGSSSGAGVPAKRSQALRTGKALPRNPAGEDAERGESMGRTHQLLRKLTRWQWMTYGGMSRGFCLVVVAGISPLFG